MLQHECTEDDAFPFPVVPCVSEERGDGFAAARNLSSGEIVLRVAPLAAVPKDAFITTVCACCFQRKDPAAAETAFELCITCKAAAFCSRCRSHEEVMTRHASECHALGALLHMRQHACTAEAAVPNSTMALTSTKRSKPNSPTHVTGHKTTSSNGSNTKDKSIDTSTLRLVMSIACFVARARQKQQRSDQAETSLQEGRFGEGDVIQDSLAELEQLMGDPEQDLSPQLQVQFAEACKLLKSVQPACARASFDAYMRWATKVHLNEHDICIPMQLSDTNRDEHSAAAAEEPSLGTCLHGAVQADGRHVTGAATKRATGRRRKQAELVYKEHVQPQTVDSTQQALLQLPQTEAVGEGLYPTVARLNHSCAPNCKLSYDSFGCLLVRVAPGVSVTQGEELFAAYVNPQAPRAVRRQHLHERYGFWCNCAVCEAGK